jgi:alpha-glucosidase
VGAALRFWRARGVDGFRLDAIDRLLKDPALRDDPPARRPPPLPEHGDVGTLEHVMSRNAPDIAVALRALREAVGDDTLLVGEVYLPAAQLAPYLEHVDCAFAFELLHAPWEAGAFRTAIEGALDPAGAAGRIAWVLSNHDFPRLPDRYGARNTRAAALLALTLPGAVFVYQGDEIGMADGAGGDGVNPPHDRAGRDAHRHPMRWDDDAPHGGFTSAAAQPWLPSTPVAGGGVAQQAREPDSVLSLYRELIAARRDLGPGLTFLDGDGVSDGVLAFVRGDAHVVALNMSDETRPAPPAGSVIRATHAARYAAGTPAPTHLEPGEGFLARR